MIGDELLGLPATDVADVARFDMLYCDDGRCRVNTFERGRPAAEGRCPGCSSVGLPIPRPNRG